MLFVWRVLQFGYFVLGDHDSWIEKADDASTLPLLQDVDPFSRSVLAEDPHIRGQSIVGFDDLYIIVLYE